MRKVFENRTAGTLDTERVVRLYTGGVREVVKGDWDGEWWNRYVIIPRRLMLNEIKRIRKLTNGARFIDGWEWWDLLPDGALEECPACKGKLHLSHAAYNGHVHGNCETEGCLSWME